MTTADTKNDKPVAIQVNDETLTAPDDYQTVEQVLALDGKSSSEFYLVELRGKDHQVEHRDPHEELKLHKGMRFITLLLGPATVS